MDNLFTKWILVAGTGNFNLSASEHLISQSLGTAIAKANFGLVVGGWEGVDYVVANSFSEEVMKQGKRLSECLIQVVRDGQQPEFKGGYIINVPSGIKEWIESVRYADAVILIGGIGGTYSTYLFALQEQKPVFPIASTEGDARKVLHDILNHSSNELIHGMPRETFTAIMQKPIADENDSRNLCKEIISRLNNTFFKDQGCIFISYSHKDKKWLDKLRMMLKPLERQKYNIWDDRTIESGDDWKEQIKKALESTKVAIFLVSPSFIASDFIHNRELKPLLKAAKEFKVRIMWLLVSSCLYDETGLEEIQAAHDVSKPLDRLNAARQNEVLVDIAKDVRNYLQGYFREE